MAGLIGYSGVGKTTLLKAILDNEYHPQSGAKVAETKGLDFAHARLYEAGNSSSSDGLPDYRSFGSMLAMEGDAAAPGTMSLSRRVSFIDCPGNLNSVATMLKGVMMADGVLILSRPSIEFSESPTLELVVAAHMMGRSIVLVQISRDSEDRKSAEERWIQIPKIIAELNISPEIPMVEVAELELGGTPSSIRGVCRELHRMGGATSVGGAVTTTSSSSSLVMLIASSHVQEEEEDTVFMTIYGRVVQGVVSAADEQQVEVRPGIVVKDDDGKAKCCPIILKVESVGGGGGDAAAAGDGVVALRASTKITPAGGVAHGQLLWSVLRGGLEGHVLGHVGSLPDVYDALKMETHPCPKVFDPYQDLAGVQVPPLERGQQLLLIVGTMSTYGKVVSAEGRTIVVAGLTPPTCARPGDTILICAPQTLSWHLIARGHVLAGRPLPVLASP